MKVKYDILWKGMLERVFDDFLRFVFPDADKRFDIKKGFTYLDKELAELDPHPEEASDTKFVDKLVKVYTRNGKEKYLLVHVEIQGNYDKTFTTRMFKYFTDAELQASDNPFAGVLWVAKGLSISGKDRDKKLLDQKVTLAKHLYGKGFEKQKIEGIFSFIDNYVLFDKPEYNLTFKEEIDQLTSKKNTMDIIEQIAEIRERKVQEKSVEAFLTNTEFSEDKIAELVGVSVSFVEKVKKNLQSKSQAK